MKILIPGISGLFGLNFAMQQRQNFDIIGTVYHHALKADLFQTITLDLSTVESGIRLVESIQPDMIINSAAVASLDLSEKHPQLAMRLNADLPKELAMAASLLDVPYVHLSTDAVFDGKQGQYSETDTINPINTYARTKARGEELVQAANPDALIARINFYGWSLSGSRSLCEFHYNNLAAGKPYTGFDDLHYTPMMVGDLIDTLLEMVALKLSGIYHVSGEESLSKYEFGVLLAEKFGFDAALVRPVSWRSLGLSAERSENLTLDVSKLRQALGHTLPTIDDGLTRLKNQLENGYRQRLMAMEK